MSDYHRPFAEQLAFFRQKTNLPTERWDDILREEHDRSFIVAGAQGADLLADLNAAVERAIADGTGLEAFRKDFKAIVARHGWTGWTGEGSKQGIAWRTRVIYQTNMATSYAAGRWQQLNAPELQSVLPYWRYKHSDSVLYPRPLHVSWDGLTLPPDHPFWKTHFPPNGWGCHCRVIPASKSDYLKAIASGKGPADAPAQGNIQGIDRGFSYAPGASVAGELRALVDGKVGTLPAPIGAALDASLPAVVRSATQAAWDSWLSEVLADPVKRGRLQVVGALSPETVSWLEQNKHLLPATAEVAIQDGLVIGPKARRHELAGDALSAEDWQTLPQIVADPERLLFDNRSGKLLFIGPPPTTGDATRQVKLALEFAFKLKKQKGETNLIVSAFRTSAAGLDGGIAGGHYEVLK
jgi:hypothetical protein